MTSYYQLRGHWCSLVLATMEHTYFFLVKECYLFRLLLSKQRRLVADTLVHFAPMCRNMRILYVLALGRENFHWFSENKEEGDQHDRRHEQLDEQCGLRRDEKC